MHYGLIVYPEIEIKMPIYPVVHSESTSIHYKNYIVIMNCMYSGILVNISSDYN